MKNTVIVLALVLVPAVAAAQRLSPQGGAVVKVDAAPGGGIVVSGTTAKPLIGVDTTAIQSRVTGTCSAGSSIRVIASDGSVTCEVDDIGTAGAGLTLLSGVFAIDPAYTQRRVTGTCTAGSAIREIAEDGTVTCETDDAGVTNSAGANVIPKSDGTNLVASSWTDNGSSTTATTALTITGTAAVTSAAGNTLTSTYSGTGIAANRNAITGTTSGATFDTTAASRTARAGLFQAFATRSTGSNDLINVGIEAAAANGQDNRAIWATSGNVLLNTTSGNTCIGATSCSEKLSVTGTASISGNATIGGTLGVTGLLTATAGVTTPGNLTTTGTGDLVVADDATIGGDLTVSGVINIAPVVQTESGTSLGTVTLGANVNVLMLSGSNPTLDGMTGGVDGRRVTICHTQASSSVLQITHENSGQSAGNRFQNPFSQTMRVRDRSCVDAIYIGDAQRWQLTEDGHFTNASTSSTFGVGSNLTVGGNTTLGNATNDTLTVAGPATFENNATVVGALTVSGHSTFQNKTKGWEFYDEFLNAINAHGNQWSLTGLTEVTAEANRPGILQLQLQATGIGTGNLHSSIIKGFGIGPATGGRGWFAGGGVLHGEWAVRGAPDTSTTYVAMVGMFDEVTDTTPGNGIYFLADPDTSANWQVCTAAGGSRSCQDTSPAIPLDSSDWYRLSWTVSADGSQVDFTVANVTDATTGTASETDDIPDSVSNQIGLGAMTTKVGDVSASFRLDYVWVNQEFTNER